jgi:hypothetical protein
VSDIAVVGSAEVIIRAITTALKRDVRDGLNDAAKEAEKSGDKSGVAWGAHFGDAAESALDEAITNKIAPLLEKELNKNGDRSGRSWARSFAKSAGSALTAGLSGAFHLSTLSALVIGLGGLIGGLVGGIVDLAAGLVAVSSAAGPAIAAIGVLGGAGLTTLLAGIGVGIGIFAQLKGKLDQLAPAAAAVRNQFTTLKAAFAQVFENAGERSVFPALKRLLDTLGPNGSIFPALRKGIDQISAAIGSVIDDITRLANNPLFQHNLATILRDNSTVIRAMGDGFVDLGAAVGSLLAAASPLINRFAKWFSSWAQHIRDLTEGAQKTGQLTNFLNRAGDVAAQLGDIFKNLFGAFRDVFQAAAPLGALFLRNFQIAARGLNAFLDTAQGRQGLANFFAPNGQVHQNISALWGLIKQLGSSLVQLAQNPGIETLARGITAALPGVERLLDGTIISLGNFAQALGTAFTSPAGAKGIEGLRTGIINLGTAFGKLAPALGPALQILGDLATNLANFLGPAFAGLSRILPSLIGPLNTIGKAISDVLLAAVQAILPLLPQLVQIVADLAKAFSGPLISLISTTARVLGALLDIAGPLVGILGALAPVLGALAAGFLALKGVNAIADGFGFLGKKLGGVADRAGPLSGTVGNLGRGFSALGGVLGVAAIGIGLVTTAIETYNQFADTMAKFTHDLANALLEGGAAAEQAKSNIADLQGFLGGGGPQDLAAGIERSVLNFSLFGHSLGELVPTFGTVGQAVNNHLQGLSKLDFANELVTHAQNDLELAIGNSGENSDEAAAAAHRLAGAQAFAQGQQDALTRATQTYADKVAEATDAVYGQINAQLAASNTDIAAQQSLLSVKDAQAELDRVRGDSTSTADDVLRAELNLQQAQNTAVASAQAAAKQIGDNITANEDLGSATDRAALSTQAQIDYLSKLAATADGPVREQLLAMIENLRKVGAENPRPTVDVDGLAAVKDKTDKLQGVLAGIGKKAYKAQLDIDSSKFELKRLQAVTGLNALGLQKPTPVANINDAPFTGVFGRIIARIGQVAKQKPTPVANMNDAPFTGIFSRIIARIGEVAKQKPTPVANMNDQPFSGIFGKIIGRIGEIARQHPTPTVSAVDNASGTIGNIQAKLSAIVSKTVTITTVHVDKFQIKSGLAASGGLIQKDQFTTVGEEGRELVFLTQGSYVATYQKAKQILAAANIQARGLAATASALGSAVSDSTAPGATSSRMSSGISIPITVNPSAGMNETELARKTGREFAWQLGRL